MSTNLYHGVVVLEGIELKGQNIHLRQKFKWNYFRWLGLGLGLVLCYANHFMWARDWMLQRCWPVLAKFQPCHIPQRSKLRSRRMATSRVDQSLTNPTTLNWFNFIFPSATLWCCFHCRGRYDNAHDSAPACLPARVLAYYKFTLKERIPVSSHPTF